MEISEKGKPALEILTTIHSQIPYSIEDFEKLSYEGKSRSIILDNLQQNLQKDSTYVSGKILGAMTTEPHEFARYVYSRYLEKNLGDPGLVQGTQKIEQEVIQMLGTLLGDSNMQGNMVSGGTEANIIAMLLAKKSRPEIKTPEIVVPDSAHYSFDKAATLMGFKIRRATLLSNYEVDLESYKSLINDNTIALVGIAGTTALGIIDPLEDFGKLAHKHNLYYHVDGAFGGLIIPFLSMLGKKVPRYNLEIPEIVSYTVDPHKFGMGVNPSGALLVRNFKKKNYGFEIPYLAGGAFKSYNILGTRPGASAISFWALMHYLGKEGFKQIVQKSWTNTQYLKEQIESIPQLEIAIEPQTPVIGLKLSKESPINLEEFDNKLRQKGWSLGLFKQWNLLRIVLMPHIKRVHLDNFLTDVKNIFK